MRRILTVRSHTMKYLLFLVVAVVALVGCGAGHANLTSITVSPQSATTTSNPQGQVGYTATGNFANGKSRELSQVDGLSWKTSPTSTGTVAATIGSTGESTCSAPGTVTVIFRLPALPLRASASPHVYECSGFIGEEAGSRILLVEDQPDAAQVLGLRQFVALVDADGRVLAKKPV